MYRPGTTLYLLAKLLFIYVFFYTATRGFRVSRMIQPTKANSGRSFICARPATNSDFKPAPREINTSIEEKIAGLSNVVLYDGVCNFCNAWVDLLLQIDTGGIFSFAPLQGETGMALLEKVGRERSDISSVVLVKKSGAGVKEKYKGYIKSDAVVEVIKELDIPFLSPAGVILAAVLPKTLKNGIYDQVADNRYRLMGTRSTIDRMNDEKYADRFMW